MRKFNKKGFTLVELLAVIVILALIMAIAIYSISGILQTSRENVYKDTALSIIHGARNQLMLSQEQKAGTYYFTADILENNNDLPFGGKINFATSSITGASAINSSSGSVSFYKATTAKTKCTSSDYSFINVSESSGTFTYSICIVPTGGDSNSKILAGTEAALMGNTTQTIFDMTAQPDV